ncbi:MAG: hypothetical protein HY541_08670 [Deltaproteobacteria bacterium]|nr:hypothetical protein [Deltaproteobacteria bacterium]
MKNMTRTNTVILALLTIGFLLASPFSGLAIEAKPSETKPSSAGSGLSPAGSGKQIKMADTTGMKDEIAKMVLKRTSSEFTSATWLVDLTPEKTEKTFSDALFSGGTITYNAKTGSSPTKSNIGTYVTLDGWDTPGSGDDEYEAALTLTLKGAIDEVTRNASDYLLVLKVKRETGCPHGSISSDVNVTAMLGDEDSGDQILDTNACFDDSSNYVVEKNSEDSREDYEFLITEPFQATKDSTETKVTFRAFEGNIRFDFYRIILFKVK